MTYSVNFNHAKIDENNVYSPSPNITNRLLIDKMRFTVIVKFDSTGKVIVDGSEITISLKSRPKGGKANLELIKRLEDYFGVSNNEIRILSGKTSKKKLVEVRTELGNDDDNDK
jgi:uncharacterized protein